MGGVGGGSHHFSLALQVRENKQTNKQTNEQIKQTEIPKTAK